MGKYIKFKQLLNILKMHFIVSVVAMFLDIIMSSAIPGKIFSLVFMFIYILALYSKSEEIARKDKKTYTDSIAYPWKGLILPIGIFIVWVFFYILYLITWRYNIIENLSGFINHLLFIMWNYVYVGFMDIVKNQFNVWALVLVFVLPIIACGAGYFAGYKGFDVSEKVVKIVYEKKEENGNTRKDD